MIFTSEESLHFNECFPYRLVHVTSRCTPYGVTWVLEKIDLCSPYRHRAIRPRSPRAGFPAAGCMRRGHPSPQNGRIFSVHGVQAARACRQTVPSYPCRRGVTGPRAGAATGGGPAAPPRPTLPRPGFRPRVSVMRIGTHHQPPSGRGGAERASAGGARPSKTVVEKLHCGFSEHGLR